MATKAVVFNTATDLLDVVDSLSPVLVFASVILPVAPLTSVFSGQLVSIVNNGGAIQVVLANATSTNVVPVFPASGYVLAAFTAGQQANVFLEGTFQTAIPGASYANVGQLVYLSAATPGGCELGPPLPTKVWAPLTVFNPGDIIQDSNGNWETCTGGGTSGGIEPPSTPPGGAGAWSIVFGGTTTDGSVTWTMSFAPLEQVVGQIVDFDGTNCTVIFHPFLNIGDVSSVGLAMPSDFSVSNSPITVAGTLNVMWNNQAANLVHAGPASGPAAPPTWRNLVADDFGPNLVAGNYLASPVTGSPNGAASFRPIAIVDLFGADGFTNTNYLTEAGNWVPIVLPSNYVKVVPIGVTPGKYATAQDAFASGTFVDLVGNMGEASFSPSDVGATILLPSCGPAGADLWTTIASYVGPNTIHVLATISTSLTPGTKIFWGMSDITSAFNSIVSTLTEFDTAIYFPSGSYIYSGPYNMSYNTTKASGITAIFGDGSENSWLIAQNPSVHLPGGFFYQQGNPFNQFLPVKPFTMQGLHFFGTNTSAAYQAEIFIAGTGGTFEDVIVERSAASQSDIMLSDNPGATYPPTRISWRVSDVTCAKSLSLTPAGGPPAMDVYLDNCAVNGTGQISVGGDRIFIQNCISTSVGANSGFAVSPFTSAIVENCKAFGTYSVGTQSGFTGITPFGGSEGSLTFRNCTVKPVSLVTFSVGFSVAGYNYSLEECLVQNCNRGFSLSNLSLGPQSNIFIKNCRAEVTASGGQPAYGFYWFPETACQGVTFLNCSVKGMTSATDVPFYDVAPANPVTLIGFSAEAGAQTNDIVNSNSTSPITLINCSLLATTPINGPSVYPLQPPSMRTAISTDIATSSDYLIECLGTFVETLPSVNLIPGQEIIVKNRGIGTITVAAAALIDGLASIPIGPGAALTVYYDAPNNTWIIEDSYSPAAGVVFNDTYTAVTYVTVITDYYVRVDSATPVNVTLTSSGAVPGKTYRVKNINTGAVTVLPASGLIDGQPNYPLNSQYDSADFEWDGTNWNVF